MVLFEMLSPLIEMTGYVSIIGSYFLGILQVNFLVLFLIVTFLFGLLTSVCGLLIEEVLFQKYGRLRDILLLIFMAFLENFGYRQLNFIIRFKALFSFLGKKRGWGKMTRSGFKKAEKGTTESTENNKKEN